MSTQPASIFLNGQPHPVTPGQSVADLIDALALAGKRVAVERNGEIVPRALHSGTALQAGDRLEIVVAVGGG